MYDSRYHILGEVVSNMAETNEHAKALVHNMWHVCVPWQRWVKHHAQIPCDSLWTEGFTAEAHLDRRNATEVLPTTKHRHLSFWGIDLQGIGSEPRVQGREGSVKKVVSRSEFTEQNFTPQVEQNFQMCAPIIFILRVAEQFMQHCIPMFNTVGTVFYVCGRTSCQTVLAPIQMLFRLDLRD